MEATVSRFESILSSQMSLVTRRQLRDGGLSRDQLLGLTRRGVLRRLRPGVFGLVGASDSWERGLLAVVLSAEGAVASHSSAARLWSFDPRPEDRYEITIGRDRRISLAGVTVHRSSTVEDQDVTMRSGIRCTSFER